MTTKEAEVWIYHLTIYSLFDYSIISISIGWAIDWPPGTTFHSCNAQDIICGARDKICVACRYTL